MIRSFKNTDTEKVWNRARVRAGQHSIRVNDQYRLCFVWTDQGADDVEITDYH